MALQDEPQEGNGVLAFRLEAVSEVRVHFTQKSGEGISDLSIDPSLKSAYAAAAPIGKLYPLVLDLTAKKQLDDLYTVVRYKIARK
jgi:hypothetical protein